MEVRFADTQSADESKALESKLRKAVARLLMPKSPGGIGSPFLFALLSGTEHIVTARLGARAIDTAATDGKRYFWNPTFLGKLSDLGVALVLAHEAYHVCLRHSAFGRDRDPVVVNIAADFVVHRVLATAAEERGHHDVFEDAGFQTQNVEQVIDGTGKPGAILYDPSLRGDVGAVYRQLMDRLPSDRLEKIRIASGSAGGPTLDQHLPHTGLAADDLQRMVHRAEKYALAAGTSPGEIKELVGVLRRPRLNLRQWLRRLSLATADGDAERSWSRLNRRSLAQGMVRPTERSRAARWLVLLDTSASMSQKCISNLVSELRPLGGEGIVVPNDTKPYWADAVSILEKDDLSRIRSTGRGGTCFEEFFQKFPKHVGIEHDIIVVLTDGGVITESLRRPRQDVLWVVTSSPDFEPPFGRAVFAPELEGRACA